jgi:hypothetical protein
MRGGAEEIRSWKKDLDLGILTKKGTHPARKGLRSENIAPKLPRALGFYVPDVGRNFIPDVCPGAVTTDPGRQDFISFG